MRFPDFDFKKIGVFELSGRHVSIRSATLKLGPPCIYAWTVNRVPVNFGSSSTLTVIQRNNAIATHINSRLRNGKKPDSGANKLYESLKQGGVIELWARIPPIGLGLTGRPIYLTEATEIELQKFYKTPWNVRGRGAAIFAVESL